MRERGGGTREVEKQVRSFYSLFFALSLWLSYSLFLFARMRVMRKQYGQPVLQQTEGTAEER